MHCIMDAGSLLRLQIPKQEGLAPRTEGGLKIESTVSVDWGATNILNTDVLRKFIRDNYNEKGACRTILIHSLLRSEITRIINEDQDIETEIIVDNLDNDVDEI